MPLVSVCVLAAIAKILGVQNQLKKVDIARQTTVISKSQEATHQKQKFFTKKFCAANWSAKT